MVLRLFVAVHWQGIPTGLPAPRATQPDASRTGVSRQAPLTQRPKTHSCTSPSAVKDTGVTPQALRNPCQETLSVTRSARSPARSSAMSGLFRCLLPSAWGFSLHPAGQTGLRPNQSHYLSSLGELEQVKPPQIFIFFVKITQIP